MQILIIKLGAAGDVLRTSPLLRVLDGHVDWVVGAGNAVLLADAPHVRRCIPWNEAATLAGASYDRVINLEDSQAAAELLSTVRYDALFGAHLDGPGNLTYTESSRPWFDMSLASRFGKGRADQLKLANRRTYQALVFEGLGFEFRGERYHLPAGAATSLRGDVAIAPKAGAVWPMKNWTGYEELARLLTARGYRVNFLPQRPSLREHIADVRNHRCLVSGDSLPMHIALGAGIPCVTLFTCTSPWEIHDYGLQRQIVSPCLDRYFYSREFHPEATTAIGVPEVLEAVIAQCGPLASGPVADPLPVPHHSDGPVP